MAPARCDFDAEGMVRGLITDARLTIDGFLELL